MDTPTATRSGVSWPRILLVVAAAVLLVFGALGLLAATVFRGLRNSGAARAALAAASRYPEVTAITGTPLVPGFMVSGAVHSVGSDGGDATLTIPVSGPRGHGTLYVVETRGPAGWVQQTLEFWPGSDPNDIRHLVEPNTAAPGTR